MSLVSIIATLHFTISLNGGFLLNDLVKFLTSIVNPCPRLVLSALFIETNNYLLNQQKTL